MAIRVNHLYAVVLRLHVQQDISQAGWRWLLANASGNTFDGELMAFKSMSERDAESTANLLRKIGFLGPERAECADFTVHFDGNGFMPPWLECIEYRELVKFAGQGGRAWKMKNSESYDLVGLTRDRPLPRKGFEVDWPPYIGKCWP